MSDEALIGDVRAIDGLLAEIVDTPEKLDVVVCLQRASAPLTTSTISAEVRSPYVAVAEALGELLRAGIVSTSSEDGAGWYVDELSPWHESFALLARLHARDRTRLLRRMSRNVVPRLRAIGHTDVAHLIRRRFKFEP